MPTAQDRILTMPKLWVDFSATAMAVTLLFFTVTNLVPFSGALIGLVPLVPLLFLAQPKLPMVTFATLILFLYLIVWELYYDHAALIKFDFYRRDGNVFVSYAPLLILPLLPISIDPKVLMRWYFLWVSVLTILFLSFYMLTGRNAITNDPEFFRLFFEAHNAAGGFYATILLLAGGYYFRTRQKWALYCTAVFTVALFETDSRGSLIGAVAAAGMFLIRPKWRPMAFIAALVINIGSIAAYSTVLDPKVYMTHDYLDYTGNHSDYAKLGDFGESGRNWTIVGRAAFMWPRALRLFEDSPIVGIGLGAYDDGPYDLRGTPGVFMQNVHPVIRYGFGHAHHSYLMFLGETGIVGLSLVLFMLFSMVSAARSLPVGLDAGVEAAIWSLMFCAFTEHRLTASSEVLPLTIFLGMAYRPVRDFRLNRHPIAPQAIQTATS